MEEFLLCNFIEITLLHGWSPVNLLHFCRTPFLKDRGLPLEIYTTTRNTQFLVSCPSPQLYFFNSTCIRRFSPDSFHSHSQFSAFPPWFPAFPSFPAWFPLFPSWFPTFSTWCTAFPPWFLSFPPWFSAFPSFLPWPPAFLSFLLWFSPFPSFPSFRSLIPHSGFYR